MPRGRPPKHNKIIFEQQSKERKTATITREEFKTMERLFLDPRVLSVTLYIN